MKFKAVKVSPMEKVFPAAAPFEEGAREKLSGLRGEIVSFQLAYYAESQGFARAEAEVISPIRANVKLRKVALVPCEYPCGPIVDEDYLTTAPGLYPDRLEELDKVSRKRYLKRHSPDSWPVEKPLDRCGDSGGHGSGRVSGDNPPHA